MIRTSVNFPDNMEDQIRKEKKRIGCTKSELIKRAITEYFEKREKAAMKKLYYKRGGI